MTSGDAAGRARVAGRSALPLPWRSLSGRLLLTLLGIHLVLAPLLLVGILDTAARNEQDRFVDQARSDAQWVKSLLETLPPDRDQQSVLRDLTLNTFRYSVELFDREGKRLAAAGITPAQPAARPREDFRFGQHGDTLYHISLPLYDDRGRLTHTVWLAYDETPILQNLRHLRLRSMELASLYLVLVGLAVWGFSRHLSRALGRLRHAAHRIATGRCDERFTPTGTSIEVQDLAHDLEHMRRKLVDGSRALAEQGIYLQALLDNIAEGVIILQPDGRIESANPAACRIFSCTPEEAQGLPIEAWLPGLNLPAPTQAQEQEPERASSQTCLARCNDGEFITTEITLGRVEHRDEQRFLLLVRDISEQIRVNNERRLHRDELAHAKRLASLGEMAAGLAHELNQPLAAINLYMQGGIRRLEQARNCPPEIREAIEKASRQAQRAGDIIARIRSFVRKAPPRPQDTDINHLIHQTLELIETELDSAGIDVELELDQNLPIARVDRLQIQQILINLTSNALNAMEEVRAEDRQLRIQTRHDNDIVCISVLDRGPGIHPEVAEQLFTPFASGRESGLGLGLAISHSIATEHNGRLEFLPRSGGGSIFMLSLPTSGPEAAV